MSETITLDVQLRAYVRRDTRRRWVAVCPKIGIASQGTTIQDAKRSLEEAVELWFESCIERGVLDQAMRESNFRPAMAGEDLSDVAERVRVERGVSDDDVRGDLFQINVAIPAYQASALLAAQS